MTLYNFEPLPGMSVTRYDSHNLSIRPLLRVERKTMLHCIVLAAKGLVGYHQTVSNQLFMVVAGSGWVRGESDQEHPISVGQVAFWQAGEWHAARTDRGLTAIVIEGSDVSPDKLSEHPAH